MGVMKFAAQSRQVLQAGALHITRPKSTAADAWQQVLIGR